jgi:chlorophyllide a reductase subunit Z
MDRVEATPARREQELVWEAAAKAALDELVERQPILVRISAAKRLRDGAEARARSAQSATVAEADVRSAVRELA